MGSMVKTYVVRDSDGHVCNEDCACAFSPETAGKAIDRHIRAHMFERNERDYMAALHAVLPTLPDSLKRRYALGGPMPWEAPDEGEAEVAATEVHRRTEQRVKETGEDYAVALHAVLAADPQLAARYAGRNRR